jgi:hypothetical protein
MHSQDDEELAFVGQERLLEAGRTGGPEELQRTLQDLHAVYQKDKSAGWPALMALQLITTKAWLSVDPDAEISDTLLDTIDPLEPVIVPWWVVQALAVAHYRHETEGISIDIALGLARPGGSGLRSKRENYELEVSRLGLAREVAYLHATDTPKIESAVGAVADRTGVKRSTVFEAWSKHKELATRQVKAILQRQTST